jgi:hypothetical protein
LLLLNIFYYLHPKNFFLSQFISILNKSSFISQSPSLSKKETKILEDLELPDKAETIFQIHHHCAFTDFHKAPITIGQSAFNTLPPHNLDSTFAESLPKI